MLSPETLEMALAFRREREWEQFHTPQNLAIAISVEAGELLEHFQWTRSGEASVADSKKPAIEQELADLAILLSYIAHDLQLDLEAAVRRKLTLNEARYPINKARGNAAKYTEL